MGVSSMNATISEAVRRLREAGLSPLGGANGCTPGEILLVESQVGRRIPSVYRDFLSVLGRATGGFMVGSDYAWDQLTRINTEARELVREGGLSLPDSAFVFLMHQGYQFRFFHFSADPDPEVNHFEEGGLFRRNGKSFSNWFLGAVDDEIRIMRDLGQ